ncbi:MAG: 50S ribosome-binding GTPase [Candidatus Lokiarchaeota archaeon]|nr:50S ribosome-binding GTPase [Candidatus Lokiarchaeota archaeon]
MSSNIGSEAQAAYQKYLDAGSKEEKIKRLEEFLSLVPKHKATEKIVALNKSRLAKLRREVEEKKQKSKASKPVSPFSIKKEGIQIILLSDYHAPGTGKTSLLHYLTGAAKDKIGKFTALPEIGIYKYKNVRFQVVDMPSLMEDASKGIGNGKEILAQVRAADLLCLLVDLSRNYKPQIELLLNELEEAEIRLNVEPPAITIEKTGSNRIQVFYITKESKENLNIPELTEKIIDLVHANGIRNGVVKVYGKISLDDVLDALTPAVVYSKAVLICTKGDLPYTSEEFEKIKSEYSNLFPWIIGTSVHKKTFPEDFGDKILSFLKKIKIFTKNAGKVAEKPLILNEDSTVKDVTLKIHKTFFELFDHAIVIREGARQKRKKVGLDYALKDRDIVEIHTR